MLRNAQEGFWLARVTVKMLNLDGMAFGYKLCNHACDLCIGVWLWWIISCHEPGRNDGQIARVADLLTRLCCYGIRCLMAQLAILCSDAFLKTLATTCVPASLDLGRNHGSTIHESKHMYQGWFNESFNSWISTISISGCWRQSDGRKLTI